MSTTAETNASDVARSTSDVARQFLRKEMTPNIR